MRAAGATNSEADTLSLFLDSITLPTHKKIELSMLRLRKFLSEATPDLYEPNTAIPYSAYIAYFKSTRILAFCLKEKAYVASTGAKK